MASSSSASAAATASSSASKSPKSPKQTDSSSSSSTAVTTSEPAAAIDVQRVIAQYKAMRAQITELANKLSEVDSDRQEHQLVVRAIEKLDPSRKCYRSIGGVLVERTVGEVLPAVEKNMAGINELIAKLTSDLQQLEKATDEYRTKYNIQMGEGEQSEQDS